MRNSTNLIAADEPNFWLRQAAELEQLEIEADAAFLLEARDVAKAHPDYERIGWGAILVSWWLAWILVSFWKVAPGGIDAVPTFLILLAIGTTVSITAWVDTR